MPHTLVVPGGQGTREPDPQVVEWLREHAAAATRLVSVCTGALLLAEAGLLSGRRVTSHWSVCGALARRFPDVSVDPDPIFVRDGTLSTSAGVTARIDLALALVEEDLGRETALTIARHLVMFLRRPGNQAQFSTQLSAQLADRPRLREVQQWIADHPAEDLSVEALARRAIPGVHRAGRGGAVRGAQPGARSRGALALVGRVSDDMIAQAVQLGIEYDPQPPYDAGSPAKAPADVVALLESMKSVILTGA